MSAIFTLREAVAEARSTLDSGTFLAGFKDREVCLLEKELLVPALADRAVTSFTDVEIIRLRQAMADRSGPVSTLTSGLTKLFTREVALGRMTPATNPMAVRRQVRFPQSRALKARGREANVLRMPAREELDHMLTAPNDWGGTALKLLVMTGVRIGELRALQGLHIIRHEPDPKDPDDRPAVLVDVRLAFKRRVSDRDIQTPVGRLGPPKTPAGVRAIPFDETVVDLVPELLDPQAYLASPDGLPVYEYQLRRALYDAQVQLGIGRCVFVGRQPKYVGVYAPHEIRHGFVAQLIEDGEDDERIMRLAGHDEISTTMGTYGYLFDRRRYDPRD